MVGADAGEAQDEGGLPLGVCDGGDAPVLERAAQNLSHLSDAIVTLHDPVVGAVDEDLRPLRARVVSLAKKLSPQIDEVCVALQNQGMLDGDRKNTLADLLESLRFVAVALEQSLAWNYGFRITVERAPDDVADDWNRHHHTIRRVALMLRRWASVMTELDAAEGPRAVGQTEEPHAQTVDRTRYSWIDEGDTYRIVFNGKVAVMKRSKGLDLYLELLSRPNPEEPISSLQLEGADCTILAAASGHFDEKVLDRQGEQLLHARVGQLEADRESASDPAAAMVIREQIDEIKSALRKSRGFGGRGEHIGRQPPERQAYKRIQSAMQGARSRMRDPQIELEALADHLERSVSGGLTWAYRPDCPVPDWGFAKS